MTAFASDVLPEPWTFVRPFFGVDLFAFVVLSDAVFSAAILLVSPFTDSA